MANGNRPGSAVAVRSRPGVVAATARRKVILGSIEGGPAGSAVAAASMVRQERKERAKRAAPKNPAPFSRTRTGRYGKKGFKTLTGRASGGVLLAEYIGGALIITFSIFTKGPEKGYLDITSEVLIRLSALTAVFFVLFLLSGNSKSGKAAAWFGLLIDLGIVFTATSQSQFTTMADIISGKPTGVDQATLDSATSIKDPQPDLLPS